ncbi:MAG TPA: RidA family protein [Planctomycetota bacterium]|nr:RidA family protein [Planctomycetota bacterium]
MTPIRSVQPATGQPPIGPYSPATVVGNTVYVSGQIPRDASGKLIADSIENATRQSLENLREVLRAAGCTPSHVVKTTVFMQDLSEFDGMNRIYGEFFGEHRPARSTVQVAKLPAGARVEIDCIAVV